MVGQAGRPVGGLRVARLTDASVRGEPDVVELDLVEPFERGLAGDRDVVLPDLLAERIDPGQSLGVDPGLAGSRVDDGQVGPGLGQDVVLEGHDAGDRVHAPRLELGQHRPEVLQDDRALGARGQRFRHLGAVGDPAAVSLDVDDHGVQLGLGEELHHPPADTSVGDTVIGEIGGLHRLGLEHHLDRALGGTDRDLLVAGDLHQQGGVVGQALQHEGALGVGANLAIVGDDRGARHRLAVSIQHASRHAGRPGTGHRPGDGGALGAPPSRGATARARRPWAAAGWPGGSPGP